MGFPCSIAGVEYNSIGSARRGLGISCHEIKRRFTSFDYPDYVCKKYPKKPSTPSKQKKHPCTINDVHYESEYAASKALGISTNGIMIRLISSNFPNYTSQHHPKECRKTQHISCRIDGIEYRSIGSAVKKLGKSHGLILKRLQSFDYPDYICDKYPKKKSVKFYKYEVRDRRYRTLQEVADMEGVSKEYIRKKMNDPRKPEYRRL